MTTTASALNTLPNGDWLLASHRSRSRHLPAFSGDYPRGATVPTLCGRLAVACHWKYDDGRWTDCKGCARRA